MGLHVEGQYRGYVVCATVKGADGMIERGGPSPPVARGEPSSLSVMPRNLKKDFDDDDSLYDGLEKLHVTRGAKEVNRNAP